MLFELSKILLLYEMSIIKKDIDKIYLAIIILKRSTPNIKTNRITNVYS